MRDLDVLQTLSGFGNHHHSEAVPNALPQRQNSPQKPALGLYAEQFSATAFTMPRHSNLRSWLYRIRPSIVQGAYERIANGAIETAPLAASAADPNPLRWNAPPLPEAQAPTDFIDGLSTVCVCGSAPAMAGGAVHLYVANRSMGDRCFYSADGHFLIVPQQGALRLRTELGRLDVPPGHIALVPRGMKFSVDLLGDTARGYVYENYGAAFQLPDRGPIGANSLADARHFKAPVAWFEDRDAPWELIAKFQGNLWRADLDHSPFDVVAWHGNCVPYVYDLADFQAINTVDFDHPDPSIFTVLTSPTNTPGTANIDFVIFPPRWMVGEDTFRPPYYHRNVMSEYMGLILGEYDAKAGGDDQGGFVPGGGSLHNCMTPHGPDAQTFEKATHAELVPQRYSDTLAFMFETSLAFHTTDFGMKTQADGGLRQAKYLECWQSLKKHFR